jgi:hypothetical protein
MNEKNYNPSSVPSSDMERTISDEPLGEKEGKGLDTCGGGKRVRIHIHSRRKRLCDPDGISAKAVIDGLVHSGILKDDSAEFISEVSYSQEKTNAEEETEISIY